MLQGQNIFVTGATGFIGRHLALSLSKNNTVTALIRGPRNDNKEKELIDAGIRVVWGDYTDPSTYSNEIRSADYVFHFAALFKIEGAKEELYRANVKGSRSLFETCQGSKIKKIVYCSTAYVSAGRNERLNIVESQPYAEKPRNWYEWSKAESEKEALAFHRERGLPIVIMRPAVVYGPGSTYAWFVAFDLFARYRGMLTGGRNMIHFVCVHDVVNAAMHLAEAGEAGEIYNVSDERPYTQREAVILSRQGMGCKGPLLSVPKWLFLSAVYFWPIDKLWLRGLSREVADFYMDSFTFSNVKLKATGFKFSYPDFKDGLGETLRWYQENKLLPIKQVNTA